MRRELFNGKLNTLDKENPIFPPFPGEGRKEVDFLFLLRNVKSQQTRGANERKK